MKMNETCHIHRMGVDLVDRGGIGQVRGGTGLLYCMLVILW